jgi:hypothetical protein
MQGNHTTIEENLESLQQSSSSPHNNVVSLALARAMGQEGYHHAASAMMAKLTICASGSVRALGWADQDRVTGWSVPCCTLFVTVSYHYGREAGSDGIVSG